MGLRAWKLFLLSISFAIAAALPHALAQSPSDDELKALNGRVAALYRAGKYGEAIPLAEQFVAGTKSIPSPLIDDQLQRWLRASEPLQLRQRNPRASALFASRAVGLVAFGKGPDQRGGIGARRHQAAELVVVGRRPILDPARAPFDLGLG
jgi:hypothetical protein